MADLCCEYTIGGTSGLVLNDDTPGTDRLVVGVDGITGLDGAPIRRQLDPAGVEDGGLVHGALFGARVITFKCLVDIRSVPIGQNQAYFDAVTEFEEDVVSTLEAFLNTATTLAWTSPTGSKSLSVYYGTDGGEVQFTGWMLEKDCQFTLIAEDPAISG